MEKRFENLSDEIQSQGSQKFVPHLSGFKFTVPL
jgi:hypothetical protein